MIAVSADADIAPSAVGICSTVKGIAYLVCSNARALRFWSIIVGLTIESAATTPSAMFVIFAVEKSLGIAGELVQAAARTKFAKITPTIAV